uniref:Uncharacterized protein n=1 Tax=Clastoptera arizonana TaxID=38151 RepID=A0A1B6E873_9HEMI
MAASTSRDDFQVSDDDFEQLSNEGSVTDIDITSDSSSDGEYDPSTQQMPVWNINTSGLRRIPFSGVSGLRVPVPGNDPADYFFLLLDDVFLESIVRETNKYALKTFCGPETTPQSRITRWKDITVEELKIFLGLMIHTGTIRINRLQDYWKTDEMFDLKYFRKHMSRDRFMLILRCLHFSHHDEDNTENRLHKVQPVIDYFNQKMKDVYYPSKELSIDEALMLWRGRLVFRQYIQNKRHRYGIKFYCLNEPQGLTMNVLVYNGANDQQVGGKGHASKVVMKLMRGYLDKGHSLYMDNYYNSFLLSAQLLANCTYSTGTLQKNRLFLPEEVTKANLQRGETIQRYAEGICVGKWKDKRDVLYISSEHENTMAVCHNRFGQPRNKPLPIIQYNAYMKGVDRSDQMLSYYPCERKTLRWYKKVFFHFIQLILVNGWVLNNQINNDRLPLYDFRLRVIKALIPQDLQRPIQVSTKKRPCHVLSKNEERDAKGIRKRKRCRMCSKEKKRTSTVYYCPQCPDKPSLCPVRCFDLYHESM